MSDQPEVKKLERKWSSAAKSFISRHGKRRVAAV
jgi:hypothetical protein